MSEQWPPPGSTIGRVHVRVPAGATAGAGVLASALRPLDLEPRGMSPHAVLSVRALEDPLPGAIATDRDGRRPIAWEAAARAALEEALRGARRPARELVSSGAAAVFFSDRAELLACALRDACNGLLGDRWWWQHLLQRRSLAGILATLEREPELVPEVLTRLASIDRPALLAVLHALSPEQSDRLLAGCCYAFAARTLAEAAIGALHGHAGTPARDLDIPARRPSQALPASAGVKEGGGPVRPPASVAPWHALVPVDLESVNLPPSTVCLAGVALALRAAPGVVRSHAFLSAVRSYVADALLRVPPAPDAQDGLHTRRAHSRAGVGAATSITVPPPPPSLEPASPVPDVHPRLASLGNARPAAKVDITASPVRPLPASSPMTSAGANVSDTTPSEASIAPWPVNTPAAPAAFAPSAMEPGRLQGAGDADVEMVVESEFAGAFFLINVADDLELYSSGFIERPDPAIAIWDFVRRVGQALAGEGFERDPLWAFLVDLARRDSPGADLEPPLEDLLPRVRAHIARLLDGQDAETLLLRRGGRIVRTPLHLDVRFALDRHPIEIRAARLDRNPGWVPAAGLHVTFLFL